MTLASFVTSWLASKRVNVEEPTWRHYEQLTRVHIIPTLSTMLLTELRRSHVRVLLDAKRAEGYAPGTIANIYNVVAMILADALADELIPAHPLAGRMPGRRKLPTREPPALTEAQLATVLDTARAAHDGYGRICDLMASTGMRPGEALGLKHDDIERHADGASLHLRQQRDRPQLKSGPRTIRVGPDVLALIPPGDGWVWGAVAGRGGCAALLHRRAIGLPPALATLERFCAHVAGLARLGRTLHPHDFRHTFISINLAAGEPLEWVSRYVGHASPSFTARVYGRWLPAQSDAMLTRYAVRLRTARAAAHDVPDASALDTSRENPVPQSCRSEGADTERNGRDRK